MFGRHQLSLLSVHRLKQQIPQVQTDCSFEWCQGKTTQIQLNAVYIHYTCLDAQAAIILCRLRTKLYVYRTKTPAGSDEIKFGKSIE